MQRGGSWESQPCMKNMSWLFLIVLLTACKKVALFDGVTCEGRCYILTGRLRELATGKPLEAKPLRFFHERDGGLIPIRPYDFLGFTLTAYDGSYQFRFPSKKFENAREYFYVEFDLDGYVPAFSEFLMPENRLTFNLDTSMIDRPQTIDIGVYYPAYLSFRVISDGAVQSRRVLIDYHFADAYKSARINKNGAIDTTIGPFVVGADVPVAIDWKASNDTIFGGGPFIVREIDSIILARNERATVTIRF